MKHGFTWNSARSSAAHWALTALLLSTLWACGGGDSETPPTEDVGEPKKDLVESDTQPDTEPESDAEDDVKDDPDVGDETDLVPTEDTGPCGPPECECNQDSDCTPIDSVCAEAVCNLDTHSCESTPLEGVECDDDNLCTAFDQCNADGVCEGSSYSCQALACQEAACNGKGSCDITTKAGYCAIEGACHVVGSTQANNACLVCDPTKIPVAWTPTLNCTPPDPVCVDESPCESNDDCPNNGECKPEGCDCAETANAGWCAGCTVDDVCYDPGVPNPNNSCQYCDVDENKFAWTLIPNCGQFIPCFGGQKCTSDAQCGVGNCVAGKCDCSWCRHFRET
ncbi:MAG TPA: hypothetical protein EYN66_09190, partial [Myxococcales bacterium]|nr:hypothetical protein [Myxococcales bacterium]